MLTNNSKNFLIKEVVNELENSTRTFYSYEGLELSSESETVMPDDFTLYQNYPNPFNPNTTIDYTLPEEADVTINICDLVGRQVNQLISPKQPSGVHSIQWNGTDYKGKLVHAGIYFYELHAGDFVQTKMLLLMK